MTIKHYGTPITPAPAMKDAMKGASFCIQWKAPSQIKVCHAIGETNMLDCSAYNAWTSGTPIEDWSPYYAWVEPWLEYPTTWAVIPDEITGDEHANDLLLRAWPHRKEKGAPVWHMHEDIRRLLELICAYPTLVCIGSSAQYRVVMSDPWQRRMDEAFRAVERFFGCTPNLHMMRGFQTLGKRWPFARVDSTDLARNHNRKDGPEPTLWVEESAPDKALAMKAMRERWDPVNCPPRFIDPGEQLTLDAA